MVHEHESKALRAEHTKKAPTEKQPTGRVVGIIKRNWRAYVSLLLLYLVGSYVELTQICLSYRLYKSYIK
jgi:hypothetical protein